jgi:hypothetical protein
VIFIVWVVLFLILGVIRWHMVYSFFGVIIAFFSLAIIRDSDVFFSYPARIEARFVAFLASTLSSVRAIDRFSAALSASAKSLFWRNICYSNS